MATVTPLTLHRPHDVTPWGFRLDGGVDYSRPLRVVGVTPGSIAAHSSLAPGDAVLSLEGTDARQLCHWDAVRLVKCSGRTLALTVRKAATTRYLYPENLVNQERLEEAVISEQKQQDLERKSRRAQSTPPKEGTTSTRSTPQRLLSPGSSGDPPKQKSQHMYLPQWFQSDCKVSTSGSVSSCQTGTPVDVHKSHLAESPWKLKQRALQGKNSNSGSPYQSVSPHIKTSPQHLTDQPPDLCSPGSLSSPRDLPVSPAKDTRFIKTTNRTDENPEKIISPQVDEQRKQLQELIHGKLKLEEQIMFAKRRSSTQDNEDRNSLVELTKNDDKKLTDTDAKVSSPPGVDEHVSDPVADKIFAKRKKETQHKYVPVNQSNKSSENVSMVERIKQAARDKFEQMHQIMNSRSLDECDKHKLREQNRIRDEQIRKMQEYNFDEKSKTQTVRSTDSPQTGGFDDTLSALRKSKAEVKPHEGPTHADVKMDIRVEQYSKSDALKSLKPQQPIQEAGAWNIFDVKPKVDNDSSLKRHDLLDIIEQFKKDQEKFNKGLSPNKLPLFEEKHVEDELVKNKNMNVLAQIIHQEEENLMKRKLELQEKITRNEKAERAMNKENIYTKKNRSSQQNKLHKKSIQSCYQESKLKPYEQQRARLQEVVQRQHEDSARKLNQQLMKTKNQKTPEHTTTYQDVVNKESLTKCSEYTGGHQYLDTDKSLKTELDLLREQEQMQMQEEEKLYGEYTAAEAYDSDDYASEWDESSEISNIELHFNKSHEPEEILHDEPIIEMRASSEDELLEAQEKSIRNLDRQIRKQKEKYKLTEQASRSHPPLPRRARKFSEGEPSGKAPKERQRCKRQYASTGDLRKKKTRTRPITKFSPDPSEFGFKPIESPDVFCKSLCNFDSDTSIMSDTPGADESYDGEPTCDISFSEDLIKTQSFSASLTSLQQLTSKPPLPFGVGRSRLRHATSEEVLRQESTSVPCGEGRRFSYAEGEAGYYQDDEGEELLGEEGEDYNRLLAEYYAAYYEAYYESFYRWDLLV